jgi:hypothetical protein
MRDMLGERAKSGWMVRMRAITRLRPVDEADPLFDEGASSFSMYCINRNARQEIIA